MAPACAADPPHFPTPAMLSAEDLAALSEARHPDPFALLGVRRFGEQWALHAVLPGALAVQAIDPHSGQIIAELHRLGSSAVFGALLDAPPAAYRLRVRWPQAGGGEVEQTLDDPYRFPPLLGEMDAWLLAEGQHLRPYTVLGAHPAEIDGAAGTRFAVWAPNAQRVSVIGDFNAWDGRRHPMRLRRECGVWEIFIPGVARGALYKFEIRTPDGALLQKADPYAFAAELRPRTASIVQGLPPLRDMAPERRHASDFDQPMSIYEVHAGSWRKHDGWRWLNWRELAQTLVPYAAEMGFTHLELLPVHEHPFDGSWGYQPTGLYAPTARYGSPEDFAAFVDAAHEAGLGVILDWVPGHFPNDPHGLARFDGTALYEHADPREGYHPDWNTCIYNFGRNEVRNFLIGNALYWLERFGVDGLRVDAVASMLYRDYSRKAGEWIPNAFGGRENLEAIAFLRRVNHIVGVERPGAVTIAEESTAFPAVSRPPTPDLQGGGLGFHYKWNMGWMHDTLQYMAREPVHRAHHQGEMTFSLVYAWNENFILPLSHDEVVHGKGSLLAKMPGDRWQRFANLRAYYGFMFGHPGKKLLFMGDEFAHDSEWQHDWELHWHLLDDPAHRGVQRLVRDLNRILRAHPALHQQDCSPAGFAWLSHDDAAQSVLAFVRLADGASPVLVVCNFTPVPRDGYRLGVPQGGDWKVLIDSDDPVYGGSGYGVGTLAIEPTPWQGQPQSLRLNLPPLSCVMLEPRG